MSAKRFVLSCLAFASGDLVWFASGAGMRWWIYQPIYVQRRVEPSVHERHTRDTEPHGHWLPIEPPNPWPPVVGEGVLVSPLDAHDDVDKLGLRDQIGGTDIVHWWASAVRPGRVERHSRMGPARTTNSPRGSAAC